MKSIPFDGGKLTPQPGPALQKRLHRVIREELTDTQRQILLAYYFQGMTIPQIAARRGINKSSVSRTLRRAEKRLVRCLRY